MKRGRVLQLSLKLPLTCGRRGAMELPLSLQLTRMKPIDRLELDGMLAL